MCVLPLQRGDNVSIVDSKIWLAQLKSCRHPALMHRQQPVTNAYLFSRLSDYQPVSFESAVPAIKRLFVSGTIASPNTSAKVPRSSPDNGSFSD